VLAGARAAEERGRLAPLADQDGRSDAAGGPQR